jgi:hypothetical protein
MELSMNQISIYLYPSGKLRSISTYQNTPGRKHTRYMIPNLRTPYMKPRYGGIPYYLIRLESSPYPPNGRTKGAVRAPD